MSVARRRQVEELLRTMLDYLPVPNRDSTAPRFASLPGPAPGQKARCTRCDATGRVHGDRPCQKCRTVKAGVESVGGVWNAFHHRHGCRLCLICDGTGHVKAGRGGTPVDEMLRPGKTERHDKAYERAERRRGTDAELARLGRLVAIREQDEAADWWLAAADRRRQVLWAGTQHAELVALLALLRVEMPSRYSILLRVLVYGEEIVLSDGMRDRLDETLDWLAEGLAGRTT